VLLHASVTVLERTHFYCSIQLSETSLIEKVVYGRIGIIKRGFAKHTGIAANDALQAQPSLEFRPTSFQALGIFALP
jgi:hypothetical protein